MKYIMTNFPPILSASENEFDLPGLGYISPSLVELKRVPKCDSLLIGQDGFGNFGLWYVALKFYIAYSKFRVLLIYRYWLYTTLGHEYAL